MTIPIVFESSLVWIGLIIWIANYFSKENLWINFKSRFNQLPLVLEIRIIVVSYIWEFPESWYRMVEQGLWNQRILDSNTTSETSSLRNLRQLIQLHRIRILIRKMGITILIIPCCEFKWNNILNYWYIVDFQPILVPCPSPLTLSFLFLGSLSTQNAKSEMLTSGRRSKEQGAL